MKKRELYLGKKPYSYIAFNYSDAVIAETLLDSMEAEGYRFWLNDKLSPTENDLQNIAKKLGASCATVLVLTENAVNDALINAVVDNTVDRRSPIVVYMTYESQEITEYLHELFDKSTNVVILRAWEQTFNSSNSIRQVLSTSKGLTFEQAVEYYERGMEILRNEASSQEEMMTAMKGISLAASNEYPPALNFLGNLSLEKARKGFDSYSTAVLYYRVASEKGDIQSIYTLGCLIADGEGFSKNPGIAASYLVIAAVKDIPDAQYRIAEMMEYGNGMMQNREEATRWYKKALDGGDRRAYIKLASRYLTGDTVARDETLAAEYFTEAAKDGNAEAYLMLAKMFRDGAGVRRDEAKSEEYFFKAADKGITEAQYNYGMCLLRAKKYVEAFKWLMVSVSDLEDGKKPDPDALFEIAECYENGKGTIQDRAKAFLYYYNAARLGHTKARLSVADCYKKGIGVPVNKRAAGFYDPRYSDDDS